MSLASLRGSRRKVPQGRGRPTERSAARLPPRVRLRLRLRLRLGVGVGVRVRVRVRVRVSARPAH